MSNRNPSEICLNCVFWDDLLKSGKDKLTDRKIGLCRAALPTISDDLYLWRRTYETDWCGGYQESPEKERQDNTAVVLAAEEQALKDLEYFGIAYLALEKENGEVVRKRRLDPDRCALTGSQLVHNGETGTEQFGPGDFEMRRRDGWSSDDIPVEETDESELEAQLEKDRALCGVSYCWLQKVGDKTVKHRLVPSMMAGKVLRGDRLCFKLRVAPGAESFILLPKGSVDERFATRDSDRTAAGAPKAGSE